MKIKTVLYKYDFKQLDGKQVNVKLTDYTPIYDDDNKTIINYRLTFQVNDITTNAIKISLFNLDKDNFATSFNKRASLLLIALNAIKPNKDGSCEFDTKDLKQFTGKAIKCTLNTTQINDNSIIWLIPNKLNDTQNAILNEIAQAQEYANISKRYDALDRSVSLDTVRENEFNREHETGNDY